MIRIILDELIGVNTVGVDLTGRGSSYVFEDMSGFDENSFSNVYSERGLAEDYDYGKSK